MATGGQRRVIVGVDVSVAGLAALRVACTRAERGEAELIAVRVLPVTTTAHPAVLVGLRDDLTATAHDLVAQAFAQALGGPPRGVPTRVLVVDGPVGPALVAIADRAGDLLVLGARRRRRAFGHQPGRYCVAYASCPVLVVPPPELARTGTARALTRNLARELDRLTGGAPAQERVEGRS